MMAAAALVNDVLWLEARNYHVAALNPKLSRHVSDVARALAQGAPAFPDNARRGFYDLEVSGGRAYIHFHEDARTVYLVAFSSK